MTTNNTANTDRRQFMARIHAALGHSRTAPPTEPPPTVDPDLVRLAHPGDDCVKLFATRAAEVGLTVHHVPAADVAAQAVAILTEAAARRVMIGAGEWSAAVSAAVRDAGMQIVAWQHSEGLDAQYDTDAGVTDVQAALAESGTLVLTAVDGRSRGLSLVPPVHVAILRARDVLPDMLDYFATVGDRTDAALPSSMVFVTGPSKTADIEGQLVVGIHGPREVHVLLVAE